MRWNGIHLAHFRLSIAFSFAALGLVSFSILSSETATLLLDRPTFFPTPQIQNTKTKLPAFTRTLFPTLTGTVTPTGTPYPKDEWISLGPEGGEVWDIVVDPVAPTTVYASSGTGGVFKSINSGEVWKSASNGVGSGGELFIDPIVPSTLYYFDTISIYTTENGAESWIKIRVLPSDPIINKFTVDPTKPSTLYAITRRQQLLKSIDGGRSWKMVNYSLRLERDFEEIYNFLAVDPGNPDTLFIGTPQGLYQSDDGGNKLDQRRYYQGYIVSGSRSEFGFYAVCRERK
jgi:hypothetical protein